MNPSKFLRLALTLAALCWAGEAASVEVKIIRDQWGVPHISSPSDEGACFGLGYAQAEDRLGEIMKNFRRAEGRMAEAFGESHLQADITARIVGHARVSRERYGDISPKARALLEAFTAGLRAFMKEHPDKVPSWSVDPEPWRVVAVRNFFTSSWPMGDAEGDLRRAGIKREEPPYLGSNQWLVSGARTTVGAPIALIDPHLSWYDQYRFFECRLYGETIKFSGFGIAGSALPSLGHNEYCSIAMTTGSGDTADIFEEKLNPDNKLQYEVDGQWRDMKVLHETIKIDAEGGAKKKDLSIYFTRHGPILAEKDGKAYALGNPYIDQVGLSDQVYEMITSKNLTDMKAALGHLQLMGQNVMIGTVQGDIYYQRTGRVPIRPDGVDPSRPIPGHVTKNDWLGIHPADDLVQITNPAQGYMQNCNVPPSAMMDDSPLRLANYRPYIYGQDAQGPHQRGAAAIFHLRKTAEKKLTIEGALGLAMNTYVHGAELWRARLASAWRSEAQADNATEDEALFFKLIQSWDLQSTPDSYGATAYLYWKKEIPAEAKTNDRWGAGPGPTFSNAQAVESLKAAARRLREERGAIQVAYGDLFRVGRRGSEVTFPVGGGSPSGGLQDAGMATLRAITFASPTKKAPWVGEGGQTSAQVVVLTRPPKSWTVTPLGQSDNPSSPHYADQAEKLFSRGLMKPTYFMDPPGLREVSESEKILQY